VPGGQEDAACWYVDLVTVSAGDGRFTVWDQYLDLIVATDGRPYRMLDLDELAAAVQEGALPWPDAVDALRRRQRLLDRHLHAGRFPAAGWADFPPAVIEPLAALPAPLPARRGR
jgi:predicted RNA-binding protein associated with RNAse of E/G family